MLLHFYLFSPVNLSFIMDGGSSPQELRRVDGRFLAPHLHVGRLRKKYIFQQGNISQKSNGLWLNFTKNLIYPFSITEPRGVKTIIFAHFTIKETEI